MTGAAALGSRRARLLAARRGAVLDFRLWQALCAALTATSRATEGTSPQRFAEPVGENGALRHVRRRKDEHRRHVDGWPR